MSKENDTQAYEKLPIYRKARDLLRDAHVITSRMNKSYKYTLGQNIRDCAIELTESVFLAYEERDNLESKVNYIDLIYKNTQRLLINYRILKDILPINDEIYGKQVESLVSIIKQYRGWREATIKQIAK
jgi:hypothetical protein